MTISRAASATGSPRQATSRAGRRTAMLFPGQGSFVPGILVGLAGSFPRAAQVLSEIDDACAASGVLPGMAVSSLLASPGRGEPEPLAVDLAILATDLTVHAMLVQAGMRADVLAGHSFGEIAALTAAGALSIATAVAFARIRAEALAELRLPAGGMLALGVPARRGVQLAGLLGDPALVLAVDNGPDACVLSGPVATLARAETVAAAAGVRAVRVAAAWPFHNPLLREAAGLVASRTAELPMTAPRTPVYSAILGGYIESAADLRKLAGCHLVQPVGFFPALRRLHDDGVRTFVEAGARQILVRLATAGLPAGIVAMAPLDRRRPAAEAADALRAAARHATEGARHE
jgi:[acyl-carrier-protein] S-malonyltransferase